VATPAPNGILAGAVFRLRPADFRHPVRFATKYPFRNPTKPYQMRPLLAGIRALPWPRGWSGPRAPAGKWPLTVIIDETLIEDAKIAAIRQKTNGPQCFDVAGGNSFGLGSRSAPIGTPAICQVHELDQQVGPHLARGPTSVLIHIPACA
jgi:hypothetical protein